MRVCCAQVRLSILFAYMFGKSQLFVQLLRWLGHAWALLRASLEPVLVIVGCVPAFTPHHFAYCSCKVCYHPAHHPASGGHWNAAAASHCRPPLEAAWLVIATVAGSGKLLVAAWGAYLGDGCALLLGPPARAAWAAGRALLELLLPIWQVSTALHGHASACVVAFVCTMLRWPSHAIVLLACSCKCGASLMPGITE
jgi:hypothetical protein